MNRSRKLSASWVLAALALVAGACGADNGTGLVTTTSQVVTTAAPTTTAPQIETTTTAAPANTAVAPEEAAPETTMDPLEANEIFYRVVRQEATRDGNRLFLEISPGDYTDVDLENLVLSVYEEREDLFELHVFDDRQAVEALVKAEGERTAEDEDLLDRHYLVSLIEGSILRFQGPFANLEGFIVGS